jgi:hypothetical protein
VLVVPAELDSKKRRFVIKGTNVLAIQFYRRRKPPPAAQEALRGKDLYRLSADFWADRFSKIT